MTDLYWHFLPADKRMRYADDREVVVGETYSIGESPLLCARGFHGSVRLMDALYYAPGPVVCRVELGGEIVEGDNKVVAQSRTVLWMRDISTELHLFACDEAERALNARRDAGDEPDPRSCRAIAVKRAWVAGEATDDELAAARAAAWDAAWDAASAAWDAARHAARAAASAARAAAWDAAWDAQNDRLTAIVESLMGEA